MSASANPLETIPESYFELDEKPQVGLIHPFPLDEIISALRTLLKREDLNITSQELGWIKKEEAFSGIGEKILPLTLFLSPLKEPLYFITSEQDLAILMNELFLSKEAASPFANPSYIQGFYQFLALEVIASLEKLNLAEGLSLRLGENPPSLHSAILQEQILCIDVTCKLDSVNLHGRILMTPSFRKEWKTHFFSHYKPRISESLKSSVPVQVALVAGYTQLTKKEWKKAKKGDLILLDRLLVDGEKKKGKVILQIGGKPIFRGKIQEDGIKLLEYQKFAEVIKSMDEKFEDEEMFEEFEEDEAEEEAKSEESDFEPGVDESVEENNESVHVEKVEEEEPFAIEKIPLTLSVEVGRIKMSLEELMKLTPGNLLDLKVAPEQGVNLTIGDKIVGKGELVKVGDVVGVRILQL